MFFLLFLSWWVGWKRYKRKIKNNRYNNWCNEKEKHAGDIKKKKKN